MIYAFSLLLEGGS